MLRKNEQTRNPDDERQSMNLVPFKRKSMNKPPPFVRKSTLFALMLVWLLTSCANPHPPLSPQPVRSVQIPPLPQAARQPQTPSACLGGCLQSLTNLRESWRKALIEAAQPD